MTEKLRAVIEVKYDKDTKKKHRYTGEILGISVGVYIDKTLPGRPDEILLKLKRVGGLP